MRHRNIVQVIYVGEGTPDEGGEPFYVMEYCKGGSLGALEGTKLPAERIIEIGSKIAEALVLIGSRMSVVHRDIKPANILLRDNGEPVLADFGIIHAMVDSSIQRATTAGTPIFMAPEVARGDAGSPQSDIYSLGATLYTLASGMRPYVGESQEQVLNQIRTEAPPALAKLAPELPPDLIRIIEGMMARELRDRYVQARDVIEDFERLKRGEPLLVRGGGFHPQTPASHPKPGPFNEPADPASKSRAGGAEPAAQSRSRPRSHWALALVVGTAFFAATAGTGIWLAVSHAGKPSQPTSPSEEVSPAEDGPAKKADPTASADKSGAPANTPPTPSQSPSKTQQTTGSAGPFGELSAAIKVRDHQRVEALSKTLGGAVCPETEAHPAFVAVEEGELESLKTLLRNKVTDGLAVDGPGKQSLVHRAIDRRQFEVLAWLADPKSAHDFPGLGMLQTCKDANGLNGLHWALSKGDLGSARVLLAAGWDPCNADSGGRTALHWAAEKGDADVLRLIVERGGNGCIAARDLGGATAMDRAMSAKNLAAIGYFKDLLATGSVEVPGWDRAEWMTKAEAAGL
jgi:serine/threonine protein kinase